MSKTLSKDLVAVCMMSGVILWIEKERAVKLEQLLKDPGAPKFVEFEGQLLNTSSIEGVYSAQTMDDLQRRKNGQFQCRWGYWHDRGEKCEHVDPTVLKKRAQSSLEHYKQHGYWPSNSPSRREMVEILGAKAMEGV